MKKLLKGLIVAMLARQVKRLRRKRSFKVVAIAGSIGKTSSKFAIAAMLARKYRVRYQSGNYNVDVTVPLVFFGLPLPSLMNPLAWLVTFIKIEWQLLRPYPYDVVIVELSTDRPGDLAKFEPLIGRADIGILTAIAPEHMEFFGDIGEVAKEELVISTMSDMLFVNTDLCDPEYIPNRPKCHTYGMHTNADYQIQDASLGSKGYDFTLTKRGEPFLRAVHPSIAVPQLYSLAVAAAVADHLGMTPDEITTGLTYIKAVSGRMQIVKGIEGVTIIDDTYNSSPEAAKAALKALYDMPAGQRIALLGNMNELGGYSASAHVEVGAFCDPAKLDYVVTLGPDANEYLAPAAEKRGCKVRRFESPYDAGEFIRSVIRPDAAVLLKGSQNKVFAEEAVKSLLADPVDVSKLVRQSKYWMKLKRSQFGRSS